MKRYQKLLSLLVILSLAMCLSGCSVITITKAVKNMNSLESVSADLALDLGMSMAMMDEATDLDITVTGPLDVDLVNEKCRATFTVDLMGEAMDLLFYYEKADGKHITYVSSDGGETWSKTETPMEAGQETTSSDLKSLALLKKLSDSFEESGTETVNGNEVVLYTGNVRWEDLVADLDLSSAMETAESAAGAELDLNALDLAALGSIPVTIGYDSENALVVKFSADLTETVQNLLPMITKIIMQSIAAESGEDPAAMENFSLSDLGIDFQIQSLKLSADLYNFDAVGEIVIPAEALAAEADTVGAVAA